MGPLYYMLLHSDKLNIRIFYLLIILVVFLFQHLQEEDLNPFYIFFEIIYLYYLRSQFLKVL